MFVDFHLLFFYETSSFLHHRAHFSVIFFLRRLETLSFFGRRKTHRTWQCRKMNKKYRLVMIFFFFFNRVVVVSRQSCGGRVYWGWLWRSLRERNSCSVIFFFSDIFLLPLLFVWCFTMSFDAQHHQEWSHRSIRLQHSTAARHAEPAPMRVREAKTLKLLNSFSLFVRFHECESLKLTDISDICWDCEFSVALPCSHRDSLEKYISSLSLSQSFIIFHYYSFCCCLPLVIFFRLHT